MDWIDVAVWMMWALASFASVATIVLSMVTLIVAFCELFLWINRCRRAALLEEALLLETIPGVPYQPPGDDDRESSCIICLTSYEAGDSCSVLPACGHMFHTHCVLQWLRTKCNCPLCRAAWTMTVAAPPDAPTHDDLNAAELMV